MSAFYIYMINIFTFWTSLIGIHLVCDWGRRFLRIDKLISPETIKKCQVSKMMFSSIFVKLHSQLWWDKWVITEKIWTEIFLEGTVLVMGVVEVGFYRWQSCKNLQKAWCIDILYSHVFPTWHQTTEATASSYPFLLTWPAPRRPGRQKDEAVSPPLDGFKHVLNSIPM